MARATQSTNEAPDQTLPFEQARDELNAIVAELETGGLGLEESLRLWQRGEELVRVCQSWLDQAQASIAKAMAEVTDDEEPGE